MSNRVIIILISCCLIQSHSLANTYYFSAVDGNDARTPLQAENPATPWKSLQQLNAFFYKLKPGDSVLFKRGETFQGNLTISVEGKSDHPIVLAAYGMGSKPQISGLKTLSNWQPDKKGIWSSSCSNCGPSVNMLIINDLIKPMGRSPNPTGNNSGYRTISNHFKNSSITDSSDIGNTDWTGAELVIRKNRFIIDRSKITSVQKNTISYQGGSFYEPTNQFGYFIQDHPSTLDQNGEWYFDKTAKKMFLYYSPTNPANLRIKISNQDTLIKCEKVQWLVFDNLSLSGANSVSISVANSSHLTVSNCDIQYSGMNGIMINGSNNIIIDGNKIMDSNNDALVVFGFQNKISNNKILNTGTIAGMGGNENSYTAMSIWGDENLVRNNEIINTGYIPLFFWGNRDTITGNLINGFGFIKDDGGGIYTWSGKLTSKDVQEGRQIMGNYVMNGTDSKAGTNNALGIAAGIYLDDNAGGITVSGNSVTNCIFGLYLHNTHAITADSNVLYQNQVQLYLKHDQPKFGMKDNLLRNNILFSSSADQRLVQIYYTDSLMANYAILDSNYYVLPIQHKSPFSVLARNGRGNLSNYNFNDWKSLVGSDQQSRILDTSEVRIFSNPAAQSATINVGAGYSDEVTKNKNNILLLPPRRSRLLLKKNL